MADSKQIAAIPLAHTANPQRLLPDGTPGINSGRPVPWVTASSPATATAKAMPTLGRSHHHCDLYAGMNVPEEPSLCPSRELAVSRRVLLSFRTNHAAVSCHCLLDERSMFSGGSIQTVRQSSLAVVRQHDSTALNRDSRPWRTALHGQNGSGPTGNPNSRPRSELGALESRSVRLSPNTLFVRAWRSLIELRIDDALAAVAQFEDEIARADTPVLPRSREFAEVLRAVLVVLKSEDDT